MADQAILEWTGGSVTLDVLAVRGTAEPDRVSRFGKLHPMLDGSMAEQILGGRREISIDFNVMTIAQRRQVVDWWLDDTFEGRRLKSVVGTPQNLAADTSTSGALTGTFHYKISAVDVIGRGVACAKVSPNVTDKRIGLSWDAVSGARYYVIFRSDDGEATYDLLDYSIVNSYTDNGATALETDVTVPADTDEIIVVCPGDELEFQWGFETELNRMLSIDLSESTVFLKADGFPG